MPRRVLGDPPRVQQILSNFMSNALKLTSEGRIELRASMAAAEAFLASWGAVVTSVLDGAEALAAVGEQGAFDLVLMDLHMPNVSGADATRAIRQRFDPARLPVLAMTAAATEGERRECLEAGMNDFIAKPFDERELLRKLRYWSQCASPVR